MAHRLSDLGSLIVKRNPNGGVYFAKQSFASGITPAHLQAYTDKFSSAAKTCAAQTKGMSGMEHVKAIRACIGQSLGR